MALQPRPPSPCCAEEARWVEIRSSLRPLYEVGGGKLVTARLAWDGVRFCGHVTSCSAKNPRLGVGVSSS